MSTGLPLKIRPVPAVQLKWHKFEPRGHHDDREQSSPPKEPRNSGNHAEDTHLVSQPHRKTGNESWYHGSDTSTDADDTSRP